MSDATTAAPAQASIRRAVGQHADPRATRAAVSAVVPPPAADTATTSPSERDTDA